MEILTLTILTLDLAGNRRSSRRRRGMLSGWCRRSWRGQALQTIWEWWRPVWRWRRWRFWEEVSRWTQRSRASLGRKLSVFFPFLPYFFARAFSFAFDDDIYLFFSERQRSYSLKDLKPWVLLQLQYKKKTEEGKKEKKRIFSFNTDCLGC